MPKRLTVDSYLSVKELERRYRQAKDPVERTRYHVIWLLAQGRPTEEVAAVVGYTSNSIRRLARRYNQQGPEGLRDRRHDHSGRPPLLSNSQQAQLLQALEGSAPDGGSWNSRKVAERMSEIIERPIGVQRGWEYWRFLERKVSKEVPLVQEYTKGKP